MEKSFDCEGWVIRHPAPTAFLPGEGPQTRVEFAESQHIIIKSPDGQELDPFYYQELLSDPAKFRRLLVERGLPEECADRVLEELEVPGR